MQEVLNKLDEEDYEKRAELLALPVDEYNEDIFLEALDEAYQMSREGSFAYDSRCESENAPDKITKFADIYEIPLVDMAEFKDKSQSDALRTRENDYGYVYTSGTSKGTSGRVPISELGMELRKINSKEIVKNRYPYADIMAVMAPEEKSLVTAPDQISRRYIFKIVSCVFDQLGAEYFVGFENGDLKMYRNKLIKHLKEDAEGIFATPDKVVAIMNFINENDISISLGKNGFVSTAGGWKGTEGIGIEKFRQFASNVFKIKQENHIDLYGATELTGAFVNCFGDENPDLKRASSSNLVFVVDQDDFIKNGEINYSIEGEGLMAFIDPLNIDIPGFILTDDVVKMTFPRVVGQ